jgi:hypothetical protein
MKSVRRLVTVQIFLTTPRNEIFVGWLAQAHFFDPMDQNLAV